MLEFRKNAERVLKDVRSGQSLVLTYRGRPVARLEPIRPQQGPVDDPIYRLAELADREGEPLSNLEIDEIVYGS
jgi:prevent-host-death family protein